MSEPLQTDIPISTGLEIPGQTISADLGVVFGLVVRSMGMVKGFTASFSALRKGEVSQYTETLEDARRHAIERMVANARLVDASAIIAVRFDSTEVAQGIQEILAYGTAVKF